MASDPVGKKWDIIVISALDKSQKLAFEQQLKSLASQSQFLDESSNVRVYEDEDSSSKTGAGGATLSILHRLHSEFGQQLYKFRILLIHAGGYSQRQPNASTLGKLFMLMPITYGTGRPLTLLELKLKQYTTLLQRMGPGVFLAASDTVEHFGDNRKLQQSEWTLDGADFVALAHPSLLDVGRQHGVYVLDRYSELQSAKEAAFQADCRLVLQKPSAEQMRTSGATFKSQDDGLERVLTDSAYWFSPKIMQIMLSLYQRLSPINCELDAYGDFLRPLGRDANDAYLKEQSVNAMCNNERLNMARRVIYETFTKSRLKVVVFVESRFYHFGTFPELLRHFCGNSDFQRDFNTANSCMSYISNQSIAARRSICVLQSHIEKLTLNATTECLIENCKFSSLDIAEKCILSNCRSKKSVSVQSPIFMMTSAVSHRQNVGYVTVAFGLEDDLKAVISPADLMVNNSTSKFSAKKLITALAWIEDEQENQPRSLWYAKLFPISYDMCDSFDKTLALVEQSVSSDDDSKDDDAWFHFSMHDILQQKDISRLLSDRATLYQEIARVVK